MLSSDAPRQVYRSWDEAMSDPDLDLSRPWFVVPDPPDENEPKAVLPDTWTEMGYLRDQQQEG